MTDNKTTVWVTIAVNIGGETKTFEADASTAGDAYDVAAGLLGAMDTEASRWIRQAGIERRSRF